MEIGGYGLKTLMFANPGKFTNTSTDVTAICIYKNAIKIQFKICINLDIITDLLSNVNKGNLIIYNENMLDI